MSIIQTLTDSAISLIPYALILIALWVCTRRQLSKADATRFRGLSVILMTPHLLAWLPNYVYQWALLDMDYSFVAETKEDAEMYLKHIDVNPKDLKEVK